MPAPNNPISFKITHDGDIRRFRLDEPAGLCLATLCKEVSQRVLNGRPGELRLKYMFTAAELEVLDSACCWNGHAAAGWSVDSDAELAKVVQLGRDAGKPVCLLVSPLSSSDASATSPVAPSEPLSASLVDDLASVHHCEIAQLEEMGFSTSRARKALEVAKGDLKAAVTELLSSPSPPPSPPPMARTVDAQGHATSSVRTSNWRAASAELRTEIRAHRRQCNSAETAATSQFRNMAQVRHNAPAHNLLADIRRGQPLRAVVAPTVEKACPRTDFAAEIRRGVHLQRMPTAVVSSDEPTHSSRSNLLSQIQGGVKLSKTPAQVRAAAGVKMVPSWQHRTATPPPSPPPPPPPPLARSTAPLPPPPPAKKAAAAARPTQRLHWSAVRRVSRGSIFERAAELPAVLSQTALAELEAEFTLPTKPTPQPSATAAAAVPAAPSASATARHFGGVVPNTKTPSTLRAAVFGEVAPAPQLRQLESEADEEWVMADDTTADDGAAVGLDHEERHPCGGYNNQSLGELAPSFIAERVAEERAAIAASRRSNTLPSECAELSRSALIRRVLSETFRERGGEAQLLFTMRSVLELDDSEWRAAVGAADMSKLSESRLNAALHLCDICSEINEPSLASALGLWTDRSFAAALRAVAQMRDFSLLASDVDDQLGALRSGNMELLTSDALVALVRAIVDAGNLLNDGTAKAAPAFRLSTIGIVLSTRSCRSRKSLLREIVQRLDQSCNVRDELQCFMREAHGHSRAPRSVPMQQLRALGRAVSRFGESWPTHNTGSWSSAVRSVTERMERLEQSYDSVQRLTDRVGAYLQEKEVDKVDACLDAIRLVCAAL